MARDLILGTAGHIDHGKTSLVQALTGVNCDRLPEEKRRHYHRHRLRQSRPAALPHRRRGRTRP